MPKHSTELPFLVDEIARLLDGMSSRIFDGHLIVDFAQGDKIGGRILHAHDDAVVLTFGLSITAATP